MPLFISRRRLERRRRLPRAAGRWALDSGGFTELRMHGGWSVTPAEYVRTIRRLRDEVGGLDWAAPMDWMCEPSMLARTGLRVADHQYRTVTNFLLLREALGSLVIPVLQGWQLSDYLRCVELYSELGVDLAAEPLVGVGSVCRRGQDDEISRIVVALHEYGLRMHGFGVRGSALQRLSDVLASSDSMAWSYDARRAAPLPGCSHRNCANCLEYALRWRSRLLGAVDQPRLFTRREIG